MIFKLFVLALVVCNCSAKHTWGYGGRAGPEYWPHYFPKCGLNRQSPIDIEPIETEYWRKRISNNYIRQNGNTKMVLKNNGHSAQVDFSHVNNLYTNVFGQKFKPIQVHFHWGDEDNLGSEHTVENRHYPVEMHFVHMNMKYSNANEAKRQRDGLLVLGSFIKIGRYNRWLQPIFSNLWKIEHEGSETRLSGILLDKLMPRRKQEFFFYDGSLTTPTCDQAVKWVVFNRVLSISQGQIDKLRSLQHKEEQHEDYLVNNFRPTQPLNGRSVYRTFHLHWSPYK